MYALALDVYARDERVSIYVLMPSLILRIITQQ